MARNSDKPGEDDDAVKSMLTSAAIINFGWTSFRRDLIHKDAGAVQVSEQCKSFYGGALLIMTVMAQMADLDLPDKLGEKIIQSIWNELNAYAQSLPDNGEGGLTNEDLRIIIPPGSRTH